MGRMCTLIGVISRWEYSYPNNNPMVDDIHPALP